MRVNWKIVALFIIALGVLLRLRDVTRLPVDYQSWRQTDTAALARNYAEEGYRLLYPQIDWRGHTAGYVESELSLYAYTVALAYGVFGVNETIAHLITVAAWAIGAWFLFLIGRRTIGDRASVFALAWFAFWSPFSIYMGRVIMGDLPAQTLIIVAMYAAYKWQDTQRLIWFALAIAGVAGAALSKLPLFYAALPLAVLILQQEGKRAFTRPRNWIGAAALVAIVAGWYYHAHQLGLETGLNFGFITKNSLFGSPDPGRNSWISTPAYLADIGVYQGFLYNFTYRLLTSFGVILLVAGVALPKRTRAQIPLLGWLAAVLIYFLVAAPTVLWSDYYTIALLAPGALFIGRTLDFLFTLISGWLRRPEARLRAGAVVLALVLVAGLAWSSYETFVSTNDLFAAREPIVQTVATGKWIQSVVPPQERIITVGGEMPTELYFAHRYGLWFEGEGEDYELFNFDKLAKQRWKYLVVYNPYWDSINEPWLQLLHTDRQVVAGGEWFIAYDLTRKHSTTPQVAFDRAPQWGKQLSLLGYDLTPARVVDSRVHLVLYWRKDAPVSQDYTGSLQILDGSGQQCGQDDHVPLKGLYAQTKWKDGEVFEDPFEVDVSKCNLSSGLTARTTLYDSDSGRRLPLTAPSADPSAFTYPITLQ